MKAVEMPMTRGSYKPGYAAMTSPSHLMRKPYDP
jgi:hypothetical protein